MTEIDLALGLLDHQLVDAEGRNCGKIDDLELEGEPGGRMEVAAILTGPGVWPARVRGPLGRLVAWIGGGGKTRLEWKHVARVAARVELKESAKTLGLADGERGARRVIERIPGSG